MPDPAAEHARSGGNDLEGNMDRTSGPDPMRFRAVPREESRTKLLLGVLVAIAALAFADIDLPLMGGDYERATAAAVKHVGGGTVTETEVERFGAMREVEIRLPDGRQVEVNLDRSFTVIGTEVDDDGPNDVDRGWDD
jgi:hypothetical protein